MRVYHLVKDELHFAVGDIIQPRIYNLDSMKPIKRQIEKEFEIIRKKDFPNYPSRLKSREIVNDHVKFVVLNCDGGSEDQADEIVKQMLEEINVKERRNDSYTSVTE